MKDIVRLKSYPNGIRIVIAEDALFGDVLAEVSEKFKDSERFFGKAKLAVTFEGRKNTQEEEDAILDTIKQESSVNIVCVVEKEKEESFERPLARLEEMAQGDFAQFYRGSLSGKKILETEQSLIVLGDVQKGSCVVSKKDIIVLGTLSGSAYAGVDGNVHFIAALHMEPESIRIGEHRGKYKSKGLFGKSKKDKPQIAYLKENEIRFEDLDLTEELLQEL